MMPIDGRGLPCLIAQALIQTFQKLKFSHEPVKLYIPSTIKHWPYTLAATIDCCSLAYFDLKKNKHFTAKIDSFPTFQLLSTNKKSNLIFFRKKIFKKPPLKLEYFSKIGKNLALLWLPNLLKSNKSTKGQLVSCWCLQFLPKNEWKQVNLRYNM